MLGSSCLLSLAVSFGVQAFGGCWALQKASSSDLLASRCSAERMTQLCVQRQKLREVYCHTDSTLADLFSS